MTFESDSEVGIAHTKHVSKVSEETNPHNGPKPIKRPSPRERVFCSCGAVISTPPNVRGLTVGDDFPSFGVTQRVEVRGCKWCKSNSSLPYIPPPIRADERVMDRLERRNLDATNYRLTRRQAFQRVRNAWAHAVDVTLFTIHRYLEPLPEGLRYQWREEVWEKMDKAAHRARLGIVAKVRGE
jgi:hypothetical protein